MSNRAESSNASRSMRRLERGGGALVAQMRAYPVGSETGLPLIMCPDCGRARVIELRVKQDTPNKGRSFFKCPRNGCFYKFPKEYLDVLVERNIIRISCEEIEEVEEVSGGTQDTGVVELEKKLEKMMRQMNFFLFAVAIIVLGVVVKYVVSN